VPLNTRGNRFRLIAAFCYNYLLVSENLIIIILHLASVNAAALENTLDSRAVLHRRQTASSLCLHNVIVARCIRCLFDIVVGWWRGVVGNAFWLK